MKNYIITIARGFGSGGREVGFNPPEKPGIPCYWSQILSMASEYSGINESLFELSDEKTASQETAEKAQCSKEHG